MTIIDRSSRSFILSIFKRLLDLGIAICLVLIPIIIITGGFKTSILGISIKANHLYSPIKILVPLILIRMVITFEVKNMVLVLVSIFMTMLFMEIAIRIWNPPIAKPEMNQIHQASAVFGWELVPGSSGIGSLGESYHINSVGFRDTEHTLRRQPGINRIMVIGDSFTFGARVNLEDTYPKQLEGILNRANMASGVINCGVIGHNMWQHYEMLKRKVLLYQPDLVILGLFEDDLASSLPPNDGYQGENPFEDQGVSGVMSHFSLWNFLRNVNAQFEYKYRYRRGYAYMKAVENRKKKWGTANPTNTNYKIMSGKMEKRKYIEFSESLKQVVITANDAGTKVLVVMIPDSVQLNDSHMQAINRFVEQACREIGVPFVDVTPALEAEEDHRSLYLFPFDAHNSPKGLRLIAQTIANKIISLHFLSPSNHELSRTNKCAESSGF